MTQEQQDKIKAIEEQMASLQKQLEEVRNPPKEVWVSSGEYCINSLGGIDEHAIPAQISFTGTYETREQAEEAIPDIRAFCQLRAYVAEFDNGWEADWNNPNQKKWYVIFDHSFNTWTISFVFSIKGTGVYMSEQCAKDLVVKLNNGEVVFGTTCEEMR